MYKEFQRVGGIKLNQRASILGWASFLKERDSGRQGGWHADGMGTHLLGLFPRLSAVAQGSSALHSALITAPEFWLAAGHRTLSLATTHGFSRASSHCRLCSGFSALHLPAFPLLRLLPLGTPSFQAPAIASLQNQSFHPACLELQMAPPEVR